MLVTGTAQAVILWDPTIRDIVIEDSTITDAAMFAVRDLSRAVSVTLRRARSTGSGQAGFHSSIVCRPAGPDLLRLRPGLEPPRRSRPGGPDPPEHPRHRRRRTIGLTGLPALCWRRSTTSNPARSNMDSVPWYAFADAIRLPAGISTG